MSQANQPASLAAEVARLEELARALETDGLTPVQMRDLSDEALAIAQRVSALLADARGASPGSGAPDGPPAAGPES
jgi:hypothetical protein